ncbi:hypothetical protein ACTD5D_38360 [Nocardia takedensis]|uniref:hypothetical protein n=1 Tax=Nocardia takedensis TaxID=259390 RepID=UPI00030CD8EF|nr:hypothetical protein [Nocardia takedensis]
MGTNRPRAREQLDVELIRELALARRRRHGLAHAALTLGAELLNHAAGEVVAVRAGQILRRCGLVEDSDSSTGDRPGLWRTRDARRTALTEGERRRRRQAVLMREVRSDLLEVVQRSRRFRFDRTAFAEEIAAGLCAATDKLVVGADMDTYDAWQRGMVLGLTEEPSPHGPPRVFATVDGGPDRGPVTVEWDTCERRLAMVTRMARAGVSPVVICDRLLADLSVSSPLRYSAR